MKKRKHAGKIHKTFDNLIQKNWTTNQSMEKLTSDITYLPFGKSMLYLSTIMDTFNSEIIAYQLSEQPDTQLAIDTLNHLKETIILHSDQGSTYTLKVLYELVKQKTLSKVCHVKEPLQITLR